MHALLFMGVDTSSPIQSNPAADVNFGFTLAPFRPIMVVLVGLSVPSCCVSKWEPLGTPQPASTTRMGPKEANADIFLSDICRVIGSRCMLFVGVDTSSPSNHFIYIYIYIYIYTPPLTRFA